jgi:flagellin-like protein
MRDYNMNKRGVSPVIATVLLISIVIVLSGIVYLWAQGFVTEGTQKFGEPIERACDSIDFAADVVPSNGDYVLEINNRANVPLYGFDVKILGEGTVKVHETTPQTVDQGESAQITLPGSEFSGVSDLIIVPIILGEKGKGKEPFTCPDQTGVGVTIA